MEKSHSENIQKLIRILKENAQRLPYININETGNYAGWVTNFHIYDRATQAPVCLNLTDEKDLFILFALASCWTKSGQWQNGACFAIHLKTLEINDPSYWQDYNRCMQEKQSRKKHQEKIIQCCDLQRASRAISFRADYYDNLYVLANSWDQIKRSLKESERNNDYRSFIAYMSSIPGLGYENRTMKIKIPLLLRELRIQNVYKHIPGKWCCVPDQRVRSAAKDERFSISLPAATNSITSILKASETIYANFHDLYDLPLFAYNDLKDLWDES